MALRLSEERLELPGVPEGLVARPLREHRVAADGRPTAVRTRTRLAKLDRVELEAANEARIELQLDPSEQRWVLGARERRWATITERYGQHAVERSAELARGGAIRLRCRVDERLTVDWPPIGWVLTDEWQQRRQASQRDRSQDREYWRARAAEAARSVEGICAALAAALRAASPASQTLPVLIYAAWDLAQGITHHGPRAFSQAHFQDTKARDDVPQILRNAGVDEETLVRLGLRRSGRLGICGPIDALVNGQSLALGLLDGPVLIRTDQRDLSLSLVVSAPMVIVENLQAAESLADRRPELAAIYTAGVPGDQALRLIGRLASEAARVLVVPDADLGGVRIAERILSVAPTAQVVDIGLFAHPPRERWPADSISALGLRAAASGPAGALARSCLGRGYPVEQELATVEAVEAWLA